MSTINQNLASIISELNKLPLSEKVETLNLIRRELHDNSPFKNEPVDLVQWVKNETVHANAYNPNAVAPVEMELLHVSIQADGYTQPIVSMLTENKVDRETVDGYHRGRIGKEREDIKQRVLGYLPVVTINESSTDLSDRMASTVRHNRARGKHAVDKMSDIVLDLKKRNWSNEKIAKNLGMDADEVLRLGQISGLTEMFSNVEFSQAWEPDYNQTDIEDEIQ